MRRARREPRAAAPRGQRQGAAEPAPSPDARRPGNAALARWLRGKPGPRSRKDRALQRVKLAELVGDASISHDDLATIARWLTARAGRDPAGWDAFLEPRGQPAITAAGALAAAREYTSRIADESEPGDIVELFEKVTPPGAEIDKLVLDSPHIADFALRHRVRGKVAGNVEVLEDAAFTQAHWIDFLAANRALLANQPAWVIEHFRMMDLRRVDGVHAFTAHDGGKIVMRPGARGFRVAVHEAIHKYGGASFETEFGHVMNEGATDYIALLVCGQIGAYIDADVYPGEKKLLIQILGVLDVTDQQLFAAYFDGDVAGIATKMTKRIGAPHMAEFKKARTAADAANTFNAGQKATHGI